MKGKIVVVTGANSGIGKATVAALADRGAHVVMVCRNKTRGEAALAEIMSNKNRSVELMFCDLSDFESVRKFACELSKKHDRIDILINNAGVLSLHRKETVQGFELHFGVNYIGQFLLTLLLLPLMSASEDARIIAVSSCAYSWGKIHFNDYNYKKRYNMLLAYGQSKLASVLFVKELARRLKEQGSKITVNALHPGIVATQIVVSRKNNLGANIAKLMKLLFLSPEEGARTAIFLASDDSVKGVSGKYFYKCKTKDTFKCADDLDCAVRLFNLSECLCGVTFDEMMSKQVTENKS